MISFCTDIQELSPLVSEGQREILQAYKNDLIRVTLPNGKETAFSLLFYSDGRVEVFLKNADKVDKSYLQSRLIASEW